MVLCKQPALLHGSFEPVAVLESAAEYRVRAVLRRRRGLRLRCFALRRERVTDRGHWGPREAAGDSAVHGYSPCRVLSL